MAENLGEKRLCYGGDLVDWGDENISLSESIGMGVGVGNGLGMGIWGEGWSAEWTGSWGMFAEAECRRSGGGG